MTIYVIGFEKDKIVDVSHMTYREYEEILVLMGRGEFGVDGSEGYATYLERRHPGRKYIIHHEI